MEQTEVKQEDNLPFYVVIESHFLKRKGQEPHLNALCYNIFKDGPIMERRSEALAYSSKLMKRAGYPKIEEYPSSIPEYTTFTHVCCKQMFPHQTSYYNFDNDGVVILNTDTTKPFLFDITIEFEYLREYSLEFDHPWEYD
ncbi:MAG: hypothetical protein U0T74_15030 [Chitinophagales bacterium]